jgi:Polyketide cyclase / dehydrase and lipid transport
MSAPIQAERVVSASPEAVFTFLCEFENHWTLTGRWVKAVVIEDSNGSVRIYGPLRILRRTARTKLVEIEPSHALHGTAELSGGTFAHIAWDLTEDGGGTDVRLSAEVKRSAVPDRLLLSLGGRRWLTRRFAVILKRLDEQFS